MVADKDGSTRRTLANLMTKRRALLDMILLLFVLGAEALTGW
jgi:hypothetical protein